MSIDLRYISSDSLEDVGTCCLPCLGSFQDFGNPKLKFAHIFLLIILIVYFFIFLVKHLNSFLLMPIFILYLREICHLVLTLAALDLIP